jgi:hypothetical protein
MVTLEAIKALAPESASDPLIDPETLAQAVRIGILDAPHLKNNPFARGIIQTRIIDGACEATDAAGNPTPEGARIYHLLQEDA